jgi:hypothetical protein
MRQSGSAQPKAAVQLATPHSPDTESPRLGIGRAEQAGLGLHNI